jgi:hypothetical protein
MDMNATVTVIVLSLDDFDWHNIQENVRTHCYKPFYIMYYFFVLAVRDEKARTYYYYWYRQRIRGICCVIQ